MSYHNRKAVGNDNNGDQKSKEHTRVYENKSTREMSTVENGLIGNDRMILGGRPYNILSLKRDKINTKSLDLSLLSLYIWYIVGLETRHTIPSQVQIDTNAPDWI